MSEHPAPQAGRRLSAKGIGAIVLGVLALVFILQNTDEVPIQFLFWDVRAGTWLALLITFALGLLVGWLLARTRNRE